MVVPFPSCPNSLSPQHLTAPPLVSAQLWPTPAAIARNAALQPGDVDRGRAVRGRAVPELPEDVAAPALDRAPARERAAVLRRRRRSRSR